MAAPSAPPGPGTSPTPVKKPAGMVWAGVILVFLSIVVLVASILVIVRAASLTGEDFEVPGAQTFRLEPGTYAVWLTNGRTYGNTRMTADISVSGPDGRVSVKRPVATSTVTTGGQEYLNRGEFDVTTAGTYEVEVDSEDAVAARVSPPLLGGRLAAGVIGIFASMLAFLVGAILLIVGLVRRGKAGRPSRSGPPGYGPPGGYGPPPGYPAPGAPQAYPAPGPGAPQGYGPPPGYAPPGPGQPPGYAPPGPGGPPPPEPPGYAPPPDLAPPADPGSSSYQPPPGDGGPPPAPSYTPPPDPGPPPTSTPAPDPAPPSGPGGSDDPPAGPANPWPAPGEDRP